AKPPNTFCVNRLQPETAVPGAAPRSNQAPPQFGHVVAIPAHEPADAFLDADAWAKSDVALEIGDVRAGFDDLAGLHGEKLAASGAPRRLLDPLQHLGDLDRVTVADIV